MQKTFHNVKIEALVGAVSKKSLQVEETALLHGLDANRTKRFIKCNGFESLSVIERPYALADVCEECIKTLFKEINVDVNSIDALIVSSQTHDYFIPGTSYTLQEKLGLKSDCLLYDLIQGCPGYVNSLMHAATLIEAKVCKRVLVCTGEIANHDIPKGALSIENYLETGDGCSATLLSFSKDASPIDFSIKNYGDKYKVVIDGSYGNRATRVADEITTKHFTIQGNEMTSFVLDTVKDHIKDFIAAKHLTFEDIECCFSQQTSKTLIQALNMMLEAPTNWIPFLSSSFGNLSSASIPVFISNNLNTFKSREKPYLLAGFGVGLASSLCIANLSNTTILPLIYFGNS